MEEIDITIRELIWDAWNVAHIARHDVSPAEVERSLADDNAVFLKAKHRRLMVLGRADHRLLATVLNEEGNSQRYYVITARDMSKKERAYYRKTQRGTK